jgi:RHS repeat-associated protein
MTNMTTNYVFTNYHRDDESGNASSASRVGLRDDYAMHRYHVNRLGRFSTIDPLARRGRNPQGLNRYSYAGNDPIGREDPSGMLDNLVCGPLGDCGGAGPSVGGDFGGDMAAGDPAVDGSGSGPGGNDFFGCDPSDPFNPCTLCTPLDPECSGCDPAISDCGCDPILGCEPYWPKVGWAHYLSLLALLRITLRIAVTTYKFASVLRGVCTYRIFCGNTSHSCGVDTVTMKAPCPHEFLVFDFLVVRTGIHSHCVRVGLAFGQDTPAPCS